MTTTLINFRASEAEKRALDSTAKHEDRTVTDILREFCRSLPHYTPNPIPTLEGHILTPEEIKALMGSKENDFYVISYKKGTLIKCGFDKEHDAVTCAAENSATCVDWHTHEIVYTCEHGSGFLDWFSTHKPYCEHETKLDFANCSVAPDDAFANCASCTDFGNNKKA